MRARAWLAGLLIWAVLGGCGARSGVLPAVDTGYLPVAPGGGVVASVVTAHIAFHDSHRYRSMAIASAGLGGFHLLIAEVRTLREHGWTHLQISLCSTPKASSDSFDCYPVPASITHAGAVAQLESPDGQEQVELSRLIHNPGSVYANAVPGQPSGSRRLLRAFDRHDALLDVSIVTTHGDFG